MLRILSNLLTYWKLKALGGVLRGFGKPTACKRMAMPGIEELSKQFKVKRKLLVGAQGISVEEFFLIPVEQWFK